MRTTAKYIILLILLFAVRQQVFCTTIYVAPTGKDSNPGTEALPFATLAAARDHVRALRRAQETSGPVEIIVAGGTYYLDRPLVFTGEGSGTEDAPLIIRGQEDSIPVFSGGVQLAVVSHNVIHHIYSYGYGGRRLSEGEPAINN